MNLEQSQHYVELLAPLLLPLIEKAVERVIDKHIENGAAIAGIDVTGDHWRSEFAALFRQWVMVGRVIMIGRTTFSSICWRCVKFMIYAVFGGIITWYTSTNPTYGAFIEKLLKGF